MTSVLNFGSSSSSNSIPALSSTSLFSNAKLPTTFIIQPPSSTHFTSQTLLTKRYKPAELGDLLMKKIKTQALSSDGNSNQQSPTIKENSDENDSQCLESTSMIEEINSPSTKSFCEEAESHNVHRMLEGVLIPQRSISTPLIVNTFNIRHAKSEAANNHKRVQHALEVLQKRMLMEQQASLLKEILMKAQADPEPLIIPPLASGFDAVSSPANFRQIKKLSGFLGDQEIIYGPVEYPLLAMAPPLFGGDKEALAVKTLGKGTGLFGSLAATRAETQRSDTDDVSSCTSEESIEALEVKRRKSKKSSTAKKAEAGGRKKKGEKKEKTVQGNEKTKSKKQK